MKAQKWNQYVFKTKQPNRAYLINLCAINKEMYITYQVLLMLLLREL